MHISGNIGAKAQPESLRLMIFELYRKRILRKINIASSGVSMTFSKYGKVCLDTMTVLLFFAIKRV